MNLADVARRNIYTCAKCLRRLVPEFYMETLNNDTQRKTGIIFRCHNQVQRIEFYPTPKLDSVFETQRWSEWLSLLKPFSGEIPEQPIRRLSYKEARAKEMEWAKAKRDAQQQKSRDQDSLKKFTNTQLGIPWTRASDSPSKPKTEKPQQMRIPDPAPRKITWDDE